MTDDLIVRDRPQVESLRVVNFRALRDVKLEKLTPLTVLLGPNGSGKSTVFDVFAFLSDCFGEGLRKAWDKRGRFKELRSRGSDGPIIIELQYRESRKAYPTTYHLEIGESKDGPVIEKEWMRCKRKRPGAPFYSLDYRLGKGWVISGEVPEEKDTRISVKLALPEYLAVNSLGQLADNPRVAALRRFITGWHLPDLSADITRGNPQVGAAEHLSATGANLPNALLWLKDHYPDRLEKILSILRERIPSFQDIIVQVLGDGRLLLFFKDSPFDEPISTNFVSDGTMKFLAYLTMLYDPQPPPLIGIEEPENYLHPKLLYDLAEECNLSSERAQLLVTTHSPFFIDALAPEQVRVLYRDEKGYTCVRRTADMPGIAEFIREGAKLGDLWMEGHFDAGDPFLTKAIASCGRS